MKEAADKGLADLPLDVLRSAAADVAAAEEGGEDQGDISRRTGLSRFEVWMLSEAESRPSYLPDFDLRHWVRCPPIMVYTKETALAAWEEETGEDQGPPPGPDEFLEGTPARIAEEILRALYSAPRDSLNDVMRFDYRGAADKAARAESAALAAVR